MSSGEGFDAANVSYSEGLAQSSADQVLKEQIKALYHRLQKGALTEADLISIEDVQFRDDGQIIDHLVHDKQCFLTHFGYFIPTYDIFRVFDDASQVVLDVGAHCGYSVLAMRDRGCKASIVSIDAMPSNIRALDQLKKLSGKDYDYVHTAISSEPGTLRLYLPVMNGFGLTGLASTGATLTDTYDGFGAHFALESVQYPSRQASGLHDPRIAILEINAARLDDVFEARGDEMQRIVAVKLDLEGHEAPALRGAERIFARTKPLLMIEEANRNPEVVKVMTGYGYFHCERHNGCLVAHSEISMMNDGFWVHPEKISEYRRLGIFKGDAP